MDESTTAVGKPTDAPAAGRFMDIQTPPKPVEAPPTASATESPEISLTETQEAPVGPAVTNVPVVAHEEPPADIPESGQASPSPESTQQPPSDPSAPPPKQAPKGHRGPLAAIIAAILVCLVLIGVVIFAYIKSNDNSNLGRESSTNSSNSNTPAAKPQASPEDIDQITSSIDQDLGSVDDVADFSATSIADDTLGL